MLELIYTSDDGQRKVVHTINETDDFTWRDMFQEYFEFLQGMGYVFDKGVQCSEDLIPYKDDTVQEERFIVSTRPECLKSDYYNCQARSDTGVCLSEARCHFQQGYDPND